MTVPSTTSRNDYVGNGSTAVYSYTFRILDDDHLILTVLNTTTNVETTLTKTTDYTVDGVLDTAGGNITLVDAGQAWLDGDGDLDTGYNLTIRRNPDLQQDTVFANGGPFLPRNHENALDKAMMVAQKQQDEIDRSWKLPETVDPANFDTTLPVGIDDVANAGKMILINPTSDGLEFGPDANAIDDAEANANAAAASAAAAATSETNAATSETNAATSETNAATSASNASTSETNAATSASNASTSETNAATSETNAAASAAAAAASAAVAARFRNRCINPAFSINQRQVTTVTDDLYFIDRWYGLTQTASITAFFDADPEDGYTDAIRLRQTQGTAQRMGVAQVIEGINVKDLRGDDAVLSPRVKVSTDLDIRYAILEWTGTEDSVTTDVVNDWTSGTYTAGNFFLGSNLTVTAVGSENVTSAGGWTTLTELTGSVSSSMNNMIVFIWTEAAVPLNTELSVDFVQLEAGDTATGPERRAVQDEYTLCRRYFWKTFPETTTPAQNAGVTGALHLYVPKQVSGVMGASATIAFPIVMRAAPTLTYYNPSASNALWRNLDAAGDHTAPVTLQAAPWGVMIAADGVTGFSPTEVDTMAVHFTAEAEL